jgi:hypothetical protein
LVFRYCLPKQYLGFCLFEAHVQLIIYILLIFRFEKMTLIRFTDRLVAEYYESPLLKMTGNQDQTRFIIELFKAEEADYDFIDISIKVKGKSSELVERVLQISKNPDIVWVNNIEKPNKRLLEGIILLF